MACCYILFSEKLNRFYIGASSETAEIRVERHNEKYYGDKKYSANANDWMIFFVFENLSFSQALKIEQHVKKMKSRAYIENLKKHIDISKKLIQKYKDS